MVAALKQLGLVLKKNIILRIREPLILLFEILWPILIFLVVVLVRMNIEPEDKSTCVYAPRANPSAGFEFLQDYACNIDNRCYDSEEEATKSRYKSGAKSLVSAVEGLYSEQVKTQQFLEELPNAVAVLDSLAQITQNEAVLNLTDPAQQPRIRDLFDDPVEVQRYLIEEGILTAAETTMVMNAMVNLTQWLAVADSLDYPGILCQPEQLIMYFNFPAELDVANISDRMCRGEGYPQAGVGDFLVSQISLQKLLNIVTDLLQRLGSPSQAQVFGAVAEMLGVLSDLNGLESLEEQLAWIGDASPWMVELLRFVEKVTSGQVSIDDFAILGGVLNGIDYVLSNSVDVSALQTLRGVVATVTEVANVFTNLLDGGFDLESLSLGSLLSNQTDILHLLTTTYNISSDVALDILSLNLNTEKFTQYISQLAMGDDVTYLLCEDPGFASMLMPDSEVTGSQLQAIQASFCSQDELAQQLVASLGLESLVTMLTEFGSSPVAIDWTGLLQDTGSLVGQLQGSLDSLDPLLQMFTEGLSVEELYRSLASTLGALQNPESSIMELLPLATQIGGMVNSQSYDLFGHIGYEMVDILEKMADRIPDSAYLLSDLMAENADLRSVVEDVLTWQPEQAPVILARLFDPLRLQALFASDRGVTTVLCDPAALAEWLDLDIDRVNVTALSAILCDRDINGALLRLADAFTLDEINQQFNFLLLVLEGKAAYNGSVDYVELTGKIQALQAKLSDQVITMVFMEALGGVWIGRDVSPEVDNNWVEFLNQFTPQYTLTIGGSLLDNLGGQLEEREAWYIVAPWLKTFRQSLNIVETILHSLTVMADDTSVPGRVTKMAVLYLPEMLYSVAETINSPIGQMFITELSMDPVGLFCDYNRLSSYLQPTEKLPLADIVGTLCTLDVNAFQAPFVDVYAETFYNIEMIVGYVSLTKTDVFEQGMDYGHLYQRSQVLATSVTTLLSDPNFWALWSGFNYTRANAAMMMLLEGAMSLELNQAAGLLAQQEQALQALLSSFGDTDMFSYYMVGIQWYLDVLNGYLQAGGDGLTLAELLGNSTWLVGRVDEVVDASPDLVESLSTAVLKPEQLMVLLLTTDLSGRELCRDLSLTQLITLTDPDRVAELEALLCDVQVETLLGAILGSGMLADIGEVTTFLTTYDPSKLPANMTFSFTELVTSVTQTLTLLTSAMNNTNPLESLLFPEFLALDVDGINGILEGLIGSLLNLTLDDVAQWSSLTTQMLAAGGGESPQQLNLIFSYIDAITEMGLRSAIFMDPVQMAEMFPLLSQFQSLLDLLPQVMSAAAVTATQPDSSPYASLIVSNPTLLCNVTNLADVVTVPPGSTLDLDAFQAQLCAINMTQLTMETNHLAIYLAGPLINVLSLPAELLPPVNLSAVFLKQSLFQQQIEALLTTDLEQMLGAWLAGLQWVNGDLWDQQVAMVTGTVLNQTSSNPTDYASVFSGLEGLSAMLYLPELNQQMNLVLAILEQVNGKLGQLGDNSSLADMFPSSPELGKLAAMTDQLPYILELLHAAATDPTPQLSALLSNPNATVVLITICHPFTNIEDYFPAPARWLIDPSVSVEALRGRFCQVDFNALMTEIQNEFDVAYITQQASLPTPVNATALYIQLDLVINNLARVISLPPREFQAQVWTDHPFWIMAFVVTGQTTLDGATSFESYQGIIQLLYSLLGDDSFILTSLAYTMNLFAEAVNQQLELFLTPNLTLYHVFSDSPQVLALLNASLGYSNEALGSVLNVPFSNPMMLLQLQAMTSQELCGQPLEYYKEVFAISDDQVAENVRTFVCNLNSSVWETIQDELSEKVGVVEFVSLVAYILEPRPVLNYLNTTNSTLAAQLTLAQLGQTIMDLEISVERLLAEVNPWLLLPEFSQSEVEELVGALYTNLSVENIDRLLPAFMAGLAPLYGTEVGEVVGEYMKSIDVVVQYLSDMLTMLRPNGNGTVDIQTLFGGADQWNQVLQTAFSEVPELIPSLTTISVDTTKLAGLLMLDSQSLSLLLCSEDMIREFFILPPSVNLTSVVQGTCGLDADTLLQEFESTFQVQGLIQRIMSPVEESLDIEALVARYTQFIVDVSAIASVTDLAFFEQTLGQFVDIDFSSLTDTDALLMALATTGGVDMSQLAASLVTTEDVLGFVYKSLTSTAASVGTVYSPENVNSVLRLMEVLMNIVGEQLARSTPGEISLGALVGNIEELEQVLELTLDLEPEVVAALLTSPVPTYAVLELVVAANSGVLDTTYCHPNITAELPASINGSADALISLLCSLDYDALWDTLEDYMDYSEILTLLQHVVDPLSMVTYTAFNWTEYAENFDDWKAALDRVLDLASLDDDVTQLFSPDRLWRFANTLMQTQVTSTLESFGLDFLSGLPPLENWMDTAMLEIATESLLTQLTMFRDRGATLSDLFTNSSLVSEWFSLLSLSVNSVTFSLPLQAEAEHYFDILLLNKTELMVVVCDVDTLMNVLMITASETDRPYRPYWDLQALSDVLCTTDRPGWWSALTEAGFSYTDIHEMSFLLMLQSGWVADPGPTGWDQVLRNLEGLGSVLADLTELSDTMAGITEGDIEAFTSAINQAALEAIVPVTVESLRGLAQIDVGVPGLMPAMVLSMQYLNTRISDLLGNGTTIALSELIPNEAEVRIRLSTMLSESSIDDLFKLAMDPTLLMQYDDLDTWQELVCNTSAFTQLVDTQSVSDPNRLQRELCDAALGGQNVMEVLLDLIDFNSFLQQVMVIAQKQATEDPFKAFTVQMQVLLGNINRIQGLEDSADMDAWLGILDGISNSELVPTEEMGLSSACEGGLSALSEAFGPAATVTLAIQQRYMEMAVATMEIVPAFANLTCMLSRASLGEMFYYLNSSGILEFTVQVTTMFTNTVQNPFLFGEFDCAAYQTTVTRYVEIVSEEYVELRRQLSSMQWCLIYSADQALPALAQIDTYLGLLRDVQYLVGNVPDLQGLTQLADLGILDILVKQILNREEVLVLLSDLLHDDPGTMNVIYDLTALTAGEIEALLNSSISALTLVELWSLTPDGLEDVLCTPGTLAYWLQFPGDLSALSAITEELCRANLTQLLTLAQQSIDLGKLIEELSLGAFDVSVEVAWLADILESVQNVTADSDGLIQMIESVSSLSITDIPDLLPQILDTIPDYDTLFESLSQISLVWDLGDETLNTFIQDIQTIVQGIRALNIFAGLSVSVMDILNDPDAVQDYMVTEVGIDEDLVTAILEAHLTQYALFDISAALDVESWACNATALDRYLDFQDRTAEQVSLQLCLENDITLGAWTNKLQQHYSAPSLIMEVLSIDTDEILENITGLEKEDFTNVIEAFLPLQQSLEAFAQNLNVSSELAAAAEALQNGETDTFSSLSNILCGRDDAFNIDDEFQLGSSDDEQENSGRRKKRQTQEEVNWQNYERSKFKTPFCKNMYNELISTESGKIIWAFLKPLLIGQIPYYPYNHITDSIMREVISIFNLADLRDFTASFVEATEAIKEISENQGDFEELEELLSEPLISFLVTQALGVDASVFTDQLVTLSAIDVEQLDAMVEVAGLLADVSECVLSSRLRRMPSEDTLEEESRDLALRNELLAAVVFLDMDHIQTGSTSDFDICNQTENSLIPKHIRVKIRMDADDVPATRNYRDGFWMPRADDSFAEDLRYFRGFIQMQDLIENAVLKLMTGCEGEKPRVESQQFPTPCHEDDIFQRFVGLYIFPILMVLAQLVVVGVSIRNVVYDKEHRLEETMKAMGLRPGVNWLGWFLNTYFMMLVTDLIIVLFAHFGRLFPYSDFALLFVYLALFSFSVLMMCYLVSVFFFRTTLAALVGLIVYLISYVPYIVIANLELHGMLFWQIFLACLSSTTAFSFGIQMVAQMELRAVGMQWSDVRGTVIYDNFPFAWNFYMMLIDSAIYILLAWYFRNVLPGKYGVRQPLYFFLLPSYWGCNCGRQSSKYKPHRSQADTGITQGLYKRTDDLNSTKSMDDLSRSKVILPDLGHGDASQQATVSEQIASKDEESLAQLPVGVSLHNLSKTFGSKKSLVNLNVNFHQEHITAFLGQNGAGKTTTVNLLTGIYEPSSGDAFVSDKSILSQMSSIRSDLGVCPQHDVLFNYLTVREHLDFFASMKASQSVKDRKSDIERMIELTGLENHANVKVKELSGGQKRRLSVAMAFIGGSKVIVLDEPTSGIDPCARRNIWDLITQNRAGRTIILSTHHMDEADVLADRIVLLHKGCILTTGSTLFLKSQYGSGYNLTVSKNVASNAPHHGNARESADAAAITGFLSQYVPDARLIEEVGTEMTFMLPTHQGQISRFPEMFAHFEKQKFDLGVSSYGVSDTTLEEVFLKLTMSADSQKSLAPDQLREWHLGRHGMETSGTNETNGASSGPANGSHPDGTRRQAPKTQQRPNGLKRMLALFYKRFLHHARDFRNYMSQIILPVLFICLAMGMTIIVPKNTDEPSLLMAPQIYHETDTFYRLEDNVPLFKDLEDSIANSPWHATACMTSDTEFSDLCDGTDGTFHTESVPANQYSAYANPGECSCTDNRHLCPEGAGGLPSPHKQLEAGLDLYNLTDNQFDIHDYLLRTHKDNIENRYGGLSFLQDGDELRAKVWYNNKGHHALPAYQSAYYNALLRTRLPEGADPSEYGISVYNHPLKLDQERLGEMQILQSVAQTGLALVILCAFCFVPAGATIFLVSERVNQERQLQMIYGVGTFMYWLVALIWDMLTYMVSVGLAVGIAAAFDIDIYTDKDNLGAFAVCLVMFGWACIPLMYLLSRLFKDVSSAYIVIFLVNFLIGLITVSCTFLLSLFTYVPEIDEAHRICGHVFKIFPQFCLGDALVLLSRNQFISKIYDNFHIDKYKDPYGYDMMAWHLIAMAIQGFVFYVLNLMLDIRCQRTSNYPPKPREGPEQGGPHHHGNKSRSRLNHRNKDRNYKEDDDVSLERQRVTTGDARSDLLVLHDLKKMFRRGFKKVRAVNDLSLGIPRGECFGLLGVNGAGKTTTFNMITGDLSPSKGVALLNGRVISEDPGNMLGQVGYCPQFDALDKFLTGRQLLYFYSLVKGLDNAKQVIDYLVKELGLESHQNRLIKTYSGGTKRKLSTAIALLGNPDLILMDEPTTGMDAGSRRMVWTNIQEAVSRGTSVVLTSHSMMECDALCTRLAVMVNGRFKCLGNSQHLKSKFGTGYTVLTRVSGVPPDLQKVTNFMLSNFDGCYLKDFHLNQLEFEIPTASVSLAQVFGRLEAEKSILHIQEYSVSQPTLEQVFISFAKHQHDGEEAEVEGPSHAYANLGYGTISSLGRGAEVRKSLKSIPGYDPGLVKPEEVAVDVNDRPSTSAASSDRDSGGPSDRPTSSASYNPSSTGSDTVSPASTIAMREPEQEVGIVDPASGEAIGGIHQDGSTTVIQL